MKGRYSLQIIDDLTSHNHHYLDETDVCCYIGDYAAGEGYEGEFNSFIQNLHKPMSRKNSFEWSYKEKAIEQAVQLVLEISTCSKLEKYTWIPIPSSKTRQHFEYDDRLIRILNKIKKFCCDLDVREVLFGSRDLLSTSHDKVRYGIDELYDAISVDNELLKTPLKENIVLFDDILTSGAHFKAAKKKILDEIGTSYKVIGFFLGRSYYVSR